MGEKYVDIYLFPTSHRTFMHPTNAFKIVREVGNLLDRPLHINCKWFREQRKHFLVEIRGFSVYDLQSYMKLRQTPKICGRRGDWQNLLQVTLKSEQLNLSKTGLDPDELRNLASKKPCIYFPNEIWQKMTDIEKSDFSDAAKCLLSGLWTPAALVAWRGSEASIKNYYKNVTGKDPDSTATWRCLTRELKTKATDFGIKDNFASYLDYYGDAKRNFVLHPNKVFSMREASQFFMNVVGLVSDIYMKN